MDKKYVHYGHQEFDKNAFKPIQNQLMLTKPSGGLWASPVDAEYGWYDWCKNEDFKENTQENAFKFTLAPTANIITISSVGDLDSLPKAMAPFPLPMVWTVIDFEQLVKNNIDAIEVVISNDYQLYHVLYGWDCDSILIMNPDIVQPIEK